MSLTSFPLDSVGLTPHQLASCTRAGLHTAADVLTVSAAELNRRLRFPKLELVHALIQAVSGGIAPNARRLDEILDEDALDRQAGPSRAGHEPSRVVNGEGPRGNGGVNGAATRKGKEPIRDGRNHAKMEEDDLSMRWSGEEWVGTGDPELDQALGGGFRVGTITEITGESAAGKSHFALSLAITSQLASLTTHPGGTIMIVCEHELETNRLAQLTLSTLARHEKPGQRKIMTRDILDNIHTPPHPYKDIEQLEHILAYQVPHMLSMLVSGQPLPHSDGVPNPAINGRANGTTRKPLPVRLIIIDSITALIRGAAADRSYGENNTAGLVLRSKYLCSLADKLKAIAHTYKVAVVVVNQVSDVFARPAPLPPSLAQGSQRSSQISQYYSDYPEPPMLYATQARWFSGQSETFLKEASLGIVWANAINTRIMLSRTGRRRLLNQEDLQPISRKRLKEQMQERQEALAASQRSGQSDGASDRNLLVDVDDVKPTLIRRLHIVFSPFAPPGTVDYVITPSGVHALLDSYRLLDATKRKAKRGKARQVDREVTDELEVEDYQATPPEAAETPPIPGSDDYEVFDDLGDVPIEFWEGTWDGRVPDYNGVDEGSVAGAPDYNGMDEGSAAEAEEQSAKSYSVVVSESTE